MHQNRFPGRSPCYDGNIAFVVSVVAMAVAAIAAYLFVLDNRVARVFLVAFLPVTILAFTFLAIVTSPSTSVCQPPSRYMFPARLET